MYLLDANVFIEAKNRYYSFDIAPGFWDWLDRAHQQLLVCSIDAVRNELLAGDDDLSEWASRNAPFFRKLGSNMSTHFQALTVWASSQNYRPNALAEFTGRHADFQIVAYARARELTVVSHESAKSGSKKKIKIPDACSAMGVRVVDTFEMLRQTNARLVLN